MKPKSITLYFDPLPNRDVYDTVSVKPEVAEEPSPKKRKKYTVWDKAEVGRLKYAKEVFDIYAGKKGYWKYVAMCVGTKNEFECKCRHYRDEHQERMKEHRLKRKREIKKESQFWNKNEDLLLDEGINLFGEDWEEVSKYVETKDKDQCRVRYERVANPSLQRCPWSKEDLITLVQGVATYKKFWKEIAENFFHNTRHRDALRHKYNTLIKLSKIDPEDDQCNDLLIAWINENYCEKVGRANCTRRYLKA